MEDHKSLYWTWNAASTELIKLVNVEKQLGFWVWKISASIFTRVIHQLRQKNSLCSLVRLYRFSPNREESFFLDICSPFTSIYSFDNGEKGDIIQTVYKIGESFHLLRRQIGKNEKSVIAINQVIFLEIIFYNDIRLCPWVGFVSGANIKKGRNFFGGCFRVATVNWILPVFWQTIYQLRWGFQRPKICQAIYS
jgi:hypothetical protein